jgi:raffinose/stachyose/melibiose transport system permease protein
MIVGKPHRHTNYYLFIAPAMVFYLVFLIFPTLYSMFFSFFNWNGLAAQKTFIGLKNYIDFFKDPISYDVLKNNLIWVVYMLVFPITIGLGLAIALNSAIPGKTLFRSIFYIPAVLPLVSVGVVWSWIYHPMFGALNVLLRSLGLSSLIHGWLAEPKTALGSVVVTAIWQGVGLPMILFLAGLQDIPNEYYEAAGIDGANFWHRLWYITIPSLKETFVIVISLLVVGSLKVFDVIYAMTWGGPGHSTQVLATWMYFNSFSFNKMGYGSAIACIMTFTSLIIIAPYIKLMSKK